jgi:hypothetical protein
MATETAMAQIHPPLPPSPVRPSSSSSSSEQQQQEQEQQNNNNINKKKKKNNVLEEAAAVAAHKLLASQQQQQQQQQNALTSDKFARKPSYFVFREPVEIPPGSVQRKKRKARTMMMTDNNNNANNMDVVNNANMDMDNNDDNDNDNDTLEDELLYYTPGLFSKFLMVTMYNLALTLHLHALSLSAESSSLSLSSSNNNNNNNNSYDTNNANDNSNNNNNNNPNNNNNNNNTKKIKKLFLRSRKLYELSFEMHLDESCDVNLLFTLALINNLGLVYYTLNEQKRSQTCFKNMFSTMMYLMDTNESSTIKEWDGLISNVMDILFYNNNSDCSMYEVVAPAA